MAAQQLKTPPVLEDEDSYVEWCNDVKIWQIYTDLDQRKQGAALYLSLTGRARECVRELTVEEIGADGGVKKITDKLDSLFMKDQNTRAYLAFKEFYDYRRPSGVSITDFIVRFEYLYHKLQQFDMKLPEGVQAFFLLNAVNVSEDNEKLARATVGDLTYDNMKEKIRKIFGDPTALEGGGGTPSVKREPVFVAEHELAFQATTSSYQKNWHGRGRGRGRGVRGRFSTNRYRTYNENRDSNSSNPFGKDGKVLKCFNCESSTHLLKDCPHPRKQNSSHEVHITLFNSKPDRAMSALIKETLGMAVLDSACTRTVTGETWLDMFMETLDESDRNSVVTIPSDTNFRFGDGIEVNSTKLIKFPACVGKTKVMIEANVVKNEIPLLLSRSSMKKAQMVLNFDSDTAEVFGDRVKLQCTSSGHYCLPLSNLLLHTDSTNSIVLHTVHIRHLSRSDKMKKALKLHRQFSHASKEKLCKLVKESRDFDDKEFLDIIKECCDACEICEKFKRQPLRPVVGIPLSDNFNQVVCMDLKEHVHNESWILHLIDSATRYSAACLITTKHQDEILRKVYHIWIAYFGSPRKFLTDNGGEFSNESFREMNEKLNVETNTTAAESPFSNGIVERHNLILAETMKKTLLDVKCEPDVALAWALSAKNSLQNHGGYSPNQLVFGHNINTPSVLIDHIPALEPTTSSDIIRKNMQALHKARENFIQAESSERIQRALRHNVRTYADNHYTNGDKVYYRRKNFKGWKGPGVVLGQDGQFVLVRHGGAYYRVHPCQLMRMKRSETKQDVQQSSPEGEGIEKERWKKKGKRHFRTDCDEEDDFEMVNDNDEDGCIETVDEPVVEGHVNEEITERDDNDNSHSGRSSVGGDESNGQSDNVIKDNSVKPRRNSCVKFKLVTSEEWQHGKILSTQPKQTGQYKNWMNIHVTGEGEPICVNWDHVEFWSDLPDTENAVLMTADQELSQEVVDAKEKELNNMVQNEVFEAVPNNDQPTISTRWIITEKFTSDGKKKVKARLVARGFEEDTSNLRKDSPTCSRECMRLVFLISAMMTWELQSIDITAAFLQGRPIEREVYLRPPADVCSEETIWHLKRCIYGLNDAPRSWYDRVKKVMMDLGATISIYDSALFLWHDSSDGKLMGILVSHVDDFAFCGNEKFQSEVIKALKQIFKVSVHANGSFKYLGLNVLQTPQDVIVNQDLYIQTMKEIELNKSRSTRKTDELNEDERKEMKRLSGQMMWVVTQTRPDLSFETCVMSNAGKHATIKNVHEANKALSKLKSQKVSIKFPNLGDPSQLRVVTYSDATYASLGDGSSQGAFIVFLKGANNLVVPISWQSKKLNRVTKSPLASETLALGEAADAGFLVSALIQEVFALSSLPPVDCYTDNASLKATLQTSKIITDRRLRVDVARIREMVQEQEIRVFWVEAKEQIADALTKRGASTKRLLEVLQNNRL